ncbi:organic solute transporter Ostalpha-domain-containing protein [Melampsora americana]|nr:organic solute transporter Ostalpha-domain-containing protein [Melampsora americana]
MTDDKMEMNSSEHGSGSGSRLDPRLLYSAGLSAGLATLLSVWCVCQQLRNYRKPILQRFVVRILIMVPIYSISSLISLFSLEASFFIDLVRDLYEAFVIYCFFVLLVEYLGGERSLLILLHGRQPTPHPWPISRFLPPMDISDPYTFLNLKRGILQYVQIKPILAIITVIFKATNTYNDGTLNSTSGYTYVSLAYNLSVSLCLYCLAMFWVCTGEDLKPFRPMPKFLCVKGIIFFSFWQGFGISILVAVGALKSTRYDTETLSLAVQDTMICFEMPLFAFLHLYAFSHHDFIDRDVNYCGRLPFIHAFRDSILGFKDVLEDSLLTFTGAGLSYKTFEPAEGALHHEGVVRERRLRAGLRYSKGGKHKYWLPMAGESEEVAHGRKFLESGEASNSGGSNRWSKMIRKIVPNEESRRTEAGYAPLLPDQAAEVVHTEQHMAPSDIETAGHRLTDHKMNTVGRWDMNATSTALDESSDESSNGSELEELGFGEPRIEEEDLYSDARRLEFGDYNNPVVDASQEDARAVMRALEDGILSSHPSAPSSKRKSSKGKSTAIAPKRSLLHDDHDEPEPSSSSISTPLPSSNISTQLPSSKSSRTQPAGSSSSRSTRRSILTLTRHTEAKPKEVLPEGCVDLLIEDKTANERKARRDRLKGEANRWTNTTGPQKIFKAVDRVEEQNETEAVNESIVDQSVEVEATKVPTPEALNIKSQTRKELDRVVERDQDDHQRNGTRDEPKVEKL